MHRSRATNLDLTSSRDGWPSSMRMVPSGLASVGVSRRSTASSRCSANMLQARRGYRFRLQRPGTTSMPIWPRAFPQLLAHLAHVRSISRFGVNVVVNEETLPDLDNIARVAADAGACEL